MLTRGQLQLDEKMPATLPTGEMLEYGDKRAGRAVFDLQNANPALTPFGVDLSLTLLWSRAMWARVCKHPLVVHHHPYRIWVDDEPSVLVVGDWVADTAPVIAEDEDDALVQWFVEQHAAAEQEAGVGASELVADEPSGDVMLTLRNGSRSTRSWRGGGTMRQR
jgi:hypothetical protein